MTEPISPETVIDEGEAQPAPQPEDGDEGDDGKGEGLGYMQETDDPQPPPPPPTQDEMEAKFKKLDASATTWRNRVSAVLGEDAQSLVPCELCGDGIPGFHWPVAVEEPRDEIHARLLAVLVEPATPDYRTANHVRACSECDGYGKVVSGSKVELNRLVVCPACIGKGFLGDAAPNLNGADTPPPVAVAVAAGDAPATYEDADVWGSPRLLGDGQENPNFGKMPQYKSDLLP